MWMRIWGRATVAQRRELRTAWARAIPRIMLDGVRWERVTGPMQATIAVLAQIGWHPVHPNKWIDAEKENMAELEWATIANAGITEAVAAVL